MSLKREITRRMSATNEEEVALESFSDDDDNDDNDDDKSKSKNKAGSDGKSAAQQRLFNARLRLNEARKRNHQQVIEENKRAHSDAEAAARERRRAWQAKQDELRKEAEARGLDPERAKLLHTTAYAAERKTRADADAAAQRFDWDMYNDDAVARRHQKLVDAQFKPHPKKRRSAAAAAGNDDDDDRGDDDHAAAAAGQPAVLDAADALDPARNAALFRPSAPREQALNKLVDALHAGAEKRAQFSRRRTEHEEADVDYLNTKNKLFNKKLSKAFDSYSADIRQNLERGSAV